MAYQQLVLSGGGTRCFWQGGFLDVVRDPLGLEPERISGVSGGAMSAACFVSRRGQQMLEHMTQAFADNDHHVRWHDEAEGEGATPHQQIYRQVVGDTLTGEAERAVADGPAFEILIGRPPSHLLDRLSGMASAVVYEVELHLGRGPHFDWAERLGVAQERVDARQAARDGRLVDLVCAAAAIPPVFELPLWDGKPVIDGGVADQAPMPEPNRGDTLILLTRDDYGAIPDDPARSYLAPSQEVPADKIDFTDPGKVRRSWDIGAEDGRRFLTTKSKT
jgi:hypothetical protein